MDNVHFLILLWNYRFNSVLHRFQSEATSKPFVRNIYSFILYNNENEYYAPIWGQIERIRSNSNDLKSRCNAITAAVTVEHNLYCGFRYVECFCTILSTY